MKNKLVLILVLGFFGTLISNAEIKLPNYISDNMIIQQNSTITITGTVSGNKNVTISTGWNGKTYKTTSFSDGSFAISIPTPPAGGPYSINIVSGKESLSLDNILSGEVWLCSGQSNMEFPIQGWATVMDNDKLIPTAHHPDIRLLQISKQTAFSPQTNCNVNMGGWVECNSATIPGFSAIAYLYGLELLKELKVPIGLIDATWGGTPAEAWTSLGCLRSINEFGEDTEALERCNFEASELQKDYERRISQWKAVANSKSEHNKNQKSGVMPTGKNWEETTLSSSFDGIVTVSKTVEIPANKTGKPATLHLGAIDDEDITYINGKELSRGSGYNTPRIYNIPADMLKEGKNEISCRISDFGGGGGFNGGDYLRIEVGGSEISLEGDWNYTVELDFSKLPAIPSSISGSSYPTVLYNAMIHPISKMPIRGVIWYQGCANVGRADQYTPLFQSLITDWRKLWKMDFPFYFVQLAGYLKPNFCQPESEWAALRNSQSKALNLPNTGMAVATDLGNPADIHPRNKQSVAHRLANQALSKTYGKERVCDAPKPISFKKNGKELIIEFDYAVFPTSCAVTGFIISGTDGNFFPANAKKMGERKISISSPSVTSPNNARYNWADYPNGNLYGETGLPIAPFATDK